VIDFKGSHFEREIVLWGVRWYVAYPISYRQLEEMMEERGVEVDHSTLNRWVLKYVPLLDQAFRVRKRRVGGSWRMDETYVRIRGQWKYLYRAVDKAGNTVDFLLTAKRDRKAALRFLYKAAGQHGTPAKITIDKSGASTAAIESYNAEHDTEVEIRQVKYLNYVVVEQDHRGIKRQVRPMMGFKSFWSAVVTLAGIELMHMIRKRQLKAAGRLRPASQFYSLAG
jgi:putative transposase